MKRCFFILLFAASLSMAGYADIDTGEIVSNGINVRVDSTIMSQPLGILQKGSKISIIEERFEWYKIRLPQDFKAYVSKQYVDIIDVNKGKVNATSLNLRLMPAADSYVIGTAQNGDILHLIGKQGDWYKIRAYPYASGWINKKFVHRTNSDKTVDELVKILKESNPAKKNAVCEELVSRGEQIIPALEPYLAAGTNANTVYSLIAVLSTISKNSDKLLETFFTKINDQEGLASGAYLDILQNIIDPQEKIPYYYYAQLNRLTVNDIKIAQKYLRQAYNLKVAACQGSRKK